MTNVNSCRFAIAQGGDQFLLDGFPDPAIVSLDELKELKDPACEIYSDTLFAGATYAQVERARTFYAGAYYIRLHNHLITQMREM